MSWCYWGHARALFTSVSSSSSRAYITHNIRCQQWLTAAVCRPDARRSTVDRPASDPAGNISRRQTDRCPSQSIRRWKVEFSRRDTVDFIGHVNSLTGGLQTRMAVPGPPSMMSQRPSRLPLHRCRPAIDKSVASSSSSVSQARSSRASVPDDAGKANQRFVNGSHLAHKATQVGSVLYSAFQYWNI